MQQCMPVADCELEFEELPRLVFGLNFASLGLSFGDLEEVSSSLRSRDGKSDTATKSSVSEERKQLAVKRIQVSGRKPFPHSLIVAFRVVDNSFSLSEEEGLVRLINEGLKVLMLGLTDETPLKSVLAAATLQYKLGLNTAAGLAAPIRAKSIAKECLEDIMLVKETLQEIGIVRPARLPTSSSSSSAAAVPCERCSILELVEKDLKDALGRIAQLERENHQLLTALDQAYFGAAPRQRSRSKDKKSMPRD